MTRADGAFSANRCEVIDLRTYAVLLATGDHDEALKVIDGLLTDDRRWDDLDLVALEANSRTSLAPA